MSHSAVHIALTTADLQASVAFYRDLLGVEPAKRREGFATFRLEHPALRLSLNAGQPAPVDAIHHMGLYLESADELNHIRTRLAESGRIARTEDAVDCCMAIQDKVWVVDPDGRPWEVYTVLDDQLKSEPVERHACCAGATG